MIDAHCHLTDERIFQSADTIIATALQAGVTELMIGGVDPLDWDRQSILKKRFPRNIKTSFGLHPWKVEQLSDDAIFSALELLELRVSEANALGETGLDFHSKRDPSRFDAQKAAFQRQLAIAKAQSKPLVLHVVKAHEVSLQMVKAAKIEAPILIHSFSGSKEEAKQWIAFGAFLSFSGCVLVSNKYEKTKSALRYVPLNRLLLETDSPDQGWRPGLNEPRLISELYDEVSSIFQLERKDLVQIVNENFKNFG